MEGDNYDLTVFTVLPEDAGEYRATFALSDTEFGAAHLVVLGRFNFFKLNIKVHELIREVS